MSGYYNDGDSHRSRSDRPRRTVYEEDIIESRGPRPAVRQTALVRRSRDDSSSSVEEIRRDFAPGEGGAYIQRRAARYPPPPGYGYGYDSNRRSDGEVDGSRRHRRRRDDRRDRAGYDSDTESSVSRSPPRRERRKSMGEQALAVLGLTGAVAAIRDRSRSRTRGRASSHGAVDRRSYSSSSSDSRSRSRTRGGQLDRKEKIQQAAKAAIAAGVVEAFRSRKDEGKGRRIITAAIAAAGIDGVIDRDDKHKNLNTIGSAVGGIAAGRLVNGPRSRSRARSQGPRIGGKDGKGGTDLAGVASAAALAGLAGKAYNDYKNRSRQNSRDRGDSRDRGRPRGGGGRADSSYSDDSRSPSPARSQRSQRKTRRRGSMAVVKDGYDHVLQTFGFAKSNPNHDPRYAKDERGNRNLDSDSDNNPRPRGGGGHGSDTDSYSSSEEEMKHKKMRGKEILTGALAGVATIHAAHSVYKSMENREKRHREVMEGKMTPEEARRRKSRAALQDAAAVGIAALGIKGAVSEWKEMKEQRDEYREACERLEEKREHRRQKMLKGEWSPSRKHQPRDDRDDSGRGRSDSAPAPRRDYDSNVYAPRYGNDASYSYAGGIPPPPMGYAQRT